MYIQAGWYHHCTLASHQSSKFILGTTQKSTKWVMTDLYKLTIHHEYHCAAFIIWDIIAQGISELLFLSKWANAPDKGSLGRKCFFCPTAQERIQIMSSQRRRDLRSETWVVTLQPCSGTREKQEVGSVHRAPKHVWRDPVLDRVCFLQALQSSKITPNNYQLETKCSNTGTLEGHLTLKPQAPTCVYTWTHATKNLKID